MSENPIPTSESPAPLRKHRRWVRTEKLAPAFWTTTSIISLIVNAVLIAILVAVASQLFTLKKLVSEQLVGGLYDNFVLMDQAHIRSVIPVRDQKVRANFTLGIEKDITVVLTENTLLENATVVSLSTGGLTIYNAPANIVLPAGTELPIHLTLDVPVDQEIPVNLDVNVDIPLEDTELHKPFSGLQTVVSPYLKLLDSLPNSWEQAVCGKSPGGFCAKLIP